MNAKLAFGALLLNTTGYVIPLMVGLTFQLLPFPPMPLFLVSLEMLVLGFAAIAFSLLDNHSMTSIVAKRLMIASVVLAGFYVAIAISTQAVLSEGGFPLLWFWPFTLIVPGLTLVGSGIGFVKTTEARRAFRADNNP